MTAAATAANLLIAEDHEAVATLYQEFFTDEGYHVTLVDTLPTVADVERWSPNLVLLDYFESGDRMLELVHALQRDRTTSHLPVVICSASLPEVRQIEPELTALGIPIVFKPFDLEELLAVICQRLHPD